jgi:hypothetical protein
LSERAVARRRQQKLRRRDARENVCVATELDRDHDHHCEYGDVDQRILDDRDHGRRAQSARIGEGGQDDERDDKRQVAEKSFGSDAHRADHDLQAKELQRDIRHGRNDAGDRDCQREPAVAVAALHEIAGSDVMVLVRDRPHARQYEKYQRIDNDGVRQREEAERSGPEHEGRHGDEGIGGVDVAIQEKPSDDGAKPTARQSPLVQLIEIAAAPISGKETQNRHQSEQRNKDNDGGPIHLHCLAREIIRAYAFA